MLCKRCNTNKPNTDFYGQQIWCKKCVCQYNREWRQKNPTKNNDYCLRWYHKYRLNHERKRITSERTVLIIKELEGKTTQAEIAEKFNVSHQYINQVWKKHFPYTKFRKKGGLK